MAVPVGREGQHKLDCDNKLIIALHCIALHYITLHYITLHYITLHYITLHYITLHYRRADRHALTPKVAGLCRAFNDTTKGKVAFLSPNEKYGMGRLGHSVA
jgi:hypothetical protein